MHFANRNIPITILMTLMILSVPMIIDIYIIYIWGKYISIVSLCISMAAISAFSCLLVLNSIMDTFSSVTSKMHKGKFNYLQFSCIPVLLLSGILLIIPGYVSSAIGAVGFFYPVRMLCARLILKRFSHFVYRSFEYLSLYIEVPSTEDDPTDSARIIAKTKEAPASIFRSIIHFKNKVKTKKRRKKQ